MENIENLIERKKQLEIESKKYGNRFDRQRKIEALDELKEKVTAKYFFNYLLKDCQTHDGIYLFLGASIMVNSIHEMFSPNEKRSILGKIVSGFKFLGGVIIGNVFPTPLISTFFNFVVPVGIVIAQPFVSMYVAVEKRYLNKLGKKQQEIDDKILEITKQIDAIELQQTEGQMKQKQTQKKKYTSKYYSPIPKQTQTQTNQQPKEKVEENDFTL